MGRRFFQASRGMKSAGFAPVLHITKKWKTILLVVAVAQPAMRSVLASQLDICIPCQVTDFPTSRLSKSKYMYINCERHSHFRNASSCDPTRTRGSIDDAALSFFPCLFRTNAENAMLSFSCPTSHPFRRLHALYCIVRNPTALFLPGSNGPVKVVFSVDSDVSCCRRKIRLAKRYTKRCSEENFQTHRHRSC